MARKKKSVKALQGSRRMKQLGYIRIECWLHPRIHEKFSGMAYESGIPVAYLTSQVIGQAVAVRAAQPK